MSTFLNYNYIYDKIQIIIFLFYDNLVNICEMINM